MHLAQMSLLKCLFSSLFKGINLQFSPKTPASPADFLSSKATVRQVPHQSTRPKNRLQKSLKQEDGVCSPLILHRCGAGALGRASQVRRESPGQPHMEPKVPVVTSPHQGWGSWVPGGLMASSVLGSPGLLWSSS